MNSPKIFYATQVRRFKIDQFVLYSQYERNDASQGAASNKILIVFNIPVHYSFISFQKTFNPNPLFIC